MKSFAQLFFSVFITLAICLLSTARGEGWVSIGPFGMEIPNHDVISGQVNAIAIDPRDANIIYIGSAEGGVWKTRDGGGSWVPLTDTKLIRTLQNGSSKGTLSIGALAIDPGKPQTVYAGTGDPNIACCFWGPALGVFRSVDGGVNWTPTGANAQKAGCSNAAIGLSVVNRIVIIPGRQSTVFAATNSGLYRYREDGSDCWANLMNGLPQSGRPLVNDIIADPYEGALYAAYPAQGIFKSDLTGNQWQMLTGGLPTSASGFFRIALAFGGRTGVGFSNPRPIVYAGFAISNDVYRLFVTRDGGSNWNELPSPPHDGQLSFNNVITVGPYNSDEMYVGQIAFHRALDGGRTGGKNDYSENPPVTTNSWTVLGCCQTLPNPFRKGLDMHGDIHDIVFAPYGSFVPDPSQVQIVFVATDGGITRGRFDSDGVVTWEPLSKGLAIGQSLAIGLDPNDKTVSVSGFWHNGNAMLLPTFQQTLPFGGGDGATARIDAGVFAAYFDCNAGFGGSLCRAHEPFMGTISSERIWSQSTGGNHWSDPHRPGNLLHLQNGLLFRATGADLASHAVLANPDSWIAIDPFWGKTGNTVTMAFKSRVLEEQPVYYLGTSTGQVWRGSPEAGWTKLCECGNGVAINSIGPDLRRNERIFVAVARNAGPGRIKQLTRTAEGWNESDVDGAFAPELSVGQIFSIVVDPTISETWGTALYIGTDQGVYRGFHGKPLVHPFAVALIPPTGFENWTWRRSPGVPNVVVTEIQVHQNFLARDLSGVIRASTYGRGLYELNRTISPLPLDPRPFAVAVQAIQIGEDGAPPPLPAQITVLLNGKRYVRSAPFEFAPGDGAEVRLEAAEEVKTDDGVLRFIGWALPDGKRSSERGITLKASDAINVVANYQETQSIADKDAKPLRVTTAVTARQVCVQNVTHELLLTWEVQDGQRPASVIAEVAYPDRRAETIGLKPIQGTQPFPMNYPAGGAVRVKMIAMDSIGTSAASESAVTLDPCGK